MAINRIALYHLETLLWIERLGTFAAAAQRLNTTQSTVSARVRELEMHLAAKLFRREGRAMSFTPAGRQLVREYEPLWNALQSILLDCGGFGEVSGVVRIGAGEIAAASCLPAFLARLDVDMPQVSIELEIDLTARLIEQLLTGKTDIALAAGPIAHPALVAQSIGSVKLLWLAHPLVADSLADPGSRPTPIWSLASHSPIHARMHAAIAASKLAGRRPNLCNNVRIMIDIAKAAGGIGIFPEPMVHDEMASGTLVEVASMPPPMPVEFYVAMRATDTEPVTAQVFEAAKLLRIPQLNR